MVKTVTRFLSLSLSKIYALAVSSEVILYKSPDCTFAYHPHHILHTHLQLPALGHGFSELNITSFPERRACHRVNDGKDLLFSLTHLLICIFQV